MPTEHRPQGTRVPAATLPPEHRCRVDDLAYETVGDWWLAHVGHVPIQAAAGLDRYMRTHDCSFAEAFAALTAPGGPIILLEDDVPPDPRRAAPRGPSPTRRGR